MFTAGTSATRQLTRSRAIWSLESRTKLRSVQFSTWPHQGIWVVEIRRPSSQWRKRWCLILIWMLMMRSDPVAQVPTCAKNVGRIWILLPNYSQICWEMSLTSPAACGYSLVEEVSIAGFVIQRQETCRTKWEPRWPTTAAWTLAMNCPEN